MSLTEELKALLYLQLTVKQFISIKVKRNRTCLRLDSTVANRNARQPARDNSADQY